jgi:ATP-binding cassette, subfamily B, bacterial MsbA
VSGASERSDQPRPFGVLPLLRPLLALHPVAAVFVVVLGVLSSAAEGIGITLFIPLIQSIEPSGATPSGVPAVVGRLVGGIPPEQRFFLLPLLILATIVFKNVLYFADYALVSWVQATTAARLRARVFDRLLAMDWADYEHRDPGTLSTLLATESWRAAQALQLLLAGAVQSCTIVVFVVLLLAISWRMTIVLVIGLLGSSLVARWPAERGKQAGHDSVRADTSFGERMWDVLAGMRIVRAFGAEDHERERFAATSEEIRRTSLRLDLITGVVGPMAETLHAALVLVIIVVALRDRSALPSLIAFAVLVYRLQPQVKNVEAVRAALFGVLGAVRAVHEFLGEEPAATANADAGSAAAGEAETSSRVAAVVAPLRDAVTLEHVSFRYPGEAKLALDDVSFRIARAGVTAIVGASGAGKTTLLHILCGFYDPTIGTVRIDGAALNGLDRSAWRSHLGLVGQDTFLFDASVRENIAYGRRAATEAEIEAAARKAHAHEFILELPQGYETRVGNRGMRLSGGQRQRIALARAFIRQPDLLILDEATNALDGESERLVRRSIEDVRGTCTVVIVAHRLDAILDADHVVVLDGGRVVEEGPLETLLGRDGTFRRLYDRQRRHERA